MNRNRIRVFNADGERVWFEERWFCDKRITDSAQRIWEYLVKIGVSQSEDVNRICVFRFCQLDR